jgi:hypothetical protein
MPVISGAKAVEINKGGNLMGSFGGSFHIKSSRGRSP